MVHRFQALPDTLGLGPEVWRVLSKCHEMRNRTEHECILDVDDRLVSDLIDAGRNVAEKIRQLIERHRDVEPGCGAAHSLGGNRSLSKVVDLHQVTIEPDHVRRQYPSAVAGDGHVGVARREPKR